jgi:uncharacterized protein
MPAPRIASCLLALLLLAGIAAPSAQAQPFADTTITGSWLGALSIPDGELRVVFNIERAPDGSLTGTMDSPDQGASGIPLSEVQREADTLRIGVQAISGQFAGVIQPSTGAIEGQWAQGPARLPLTIRKVEAAPRTNRPQVPEEPFPYRTVELTFTNPNGISLVGTLTLPEGAGPHPGVVLIAGSGPQDRDAVVAGHPLMLVWADVLTRNGFAVLRYDERGIGASGGVHETATTADLSVDTEAAATALAQHEAVDPNRVALLGHSEGGTIATLVATRSDAVNAVVLLAAPATPGSEILSDQLDIRARASGIDKRTRAMQKGTQERIFRAIRTNESDSLAMAKELRAIMIDAQGIDGEEVIQKEIQRLTSPWLRAFITYDPIEALRQLDVPVLAIYGSNDMQVLPAKNASALREALENSKSSDTTVRTLDGLNHLLQPSETGRPVEYGRIETTVSPEVIRVVSDWLAGQFK